MVAINGTRDDLAGGLEMDSQCCELEVGLSQLEIGCLRQQVQERELREGELGLAWFTPSLIGQPRAGASLGTWTAARYLAQSSHLPCPADHVSFREAALTTHRRLPTVGRFEP